MSVSKKDLQKAFGALSDAFSSDRKDERSDSDKALDALESALNSNDQKEIDAAMKSVSDVVSNADENADHTDLTARINVLQARAAARQAK